MIPTNIKIDKLRLDKLKPIELPELGNTMEVTTLYDSYYNGKLMDELLNPPHGSIALALDSIRISKQKLYYHICGLSNNWLKMHGFPMIRRIHK